MWLVSLLASFSLQLYQLRWTLIRLRQETRLQMKLPGIEDNMVQRMEQLKA
jgi:hypothetical protein